MESKPIVDALSNTHSGRASDPISKEAPLKGLNTTPSKSASALMLRPAQESDYNFYRKLFPEFEIDQPSCPPEMWVRESMSDALIATIESTPVGYIRIQYFTDVFYITWLTIAKEWPQEEIVAKTLGLLKELAKERGYKRWALHCDVLHAVPRQMYRKAGMEKVEGAILLHLKAPVESVEAYQKEDSQLITVAINDPKEWADLEAKYNHIRGQFHVGAKDDYTPIKLTTKNSQTVGCALYIRRQRILLIPSVDKLEFLPALLHGVRKFQEAGPYEDPHFEHFWIQPKRDVADHMMANIKRAMICETFDYLEGSLL